jgi:hypothetical protein
LMEKLNTWQTQFPSHCNDKNTQQVDNTAPLQLASHYTRILIIRAIYRPFCTFNSKFSSQAIGSMDPEVEAYAHFRVAAKTAANKFASYARDIGDRQIRAFWPFCKLGLATGKQHLHKLTFTGCTGAWATLCNLWLLLYSSAPSSTERDECRAGLEESRNLLRLRATSFPILQFALLRVNSLFWKGLDNVVDVERS